VEGPFGLVISTSSTASNEFANRVTISEAAPQVDRMLSVESRALTGAVTPSHHRIYTPPRIFSICVALLLLAIDQLQFGKICHIRKKKIKKIQLEIVHVRI
jgi:hypothetical protein